MMPIRRFKVSCLTCLVGGEGTSIRRNSDRKMHRVMKLLDLCLKIRSISRTKDRSLVSFTLILDLYLWKHHLMCLFAALSRHYLKYDMISAFERSKQHSLTFRII